MGGTQHSAWTRGKRIGLTGGIGSGKSTVAKTFAELGALVVDSDAIQRLVVAPGSPGLAEIVEEFGEEVILESGELNRPALGARVFSDASARQKLEAITHPRIAEETQRQMALAEPGQVVVHDIPLLVELGMQDNYDLVVVVDSPVKTRIERLMRDRGMSREDAQARIGAQASEAQRRAVADVWIDNIGTRDELEAKARQVWAEHIA